MEHRCLASIMKLGVFLRASPYSCDGRFGVPLKSVNPTLVLSPDKELVIAPACFLVFPSHGKRSQLCAVSSIAVRSGRLGNVAHHAAQCSPKRHIGMKVWGFPLLHLLGRPL